MFCIMEHFMEQWGQIEELWNTLWNKTVTLWPSPTGVPGILPRHSF